MTKDQHRLLRHIWIVVVLKLVVLFLIWWFFMRTHRIEPETDRILEHFSPPITQLNSVNQEGANP